MYLSLPITDPVLQFSILVAAALVAQLTVERMHLPRLVGLLVLGMLLGPDGGGVMTRAPMVEFLGDIGLIYVMFMAGLEIDLDTVRAHKREPVTLGALSFGLCLAPAVATALLLGWTWPSALMLGALISSHTLLAYRIVEQQGLLHRRAVVAAVGGTLLTDTLALVVLAVVIQNVGDERNLLQKLGPLLWLLVVVVVSLWLVPRASRRMLEVKVSPAEQALYVLGVPLGLAVLTRLIGTEDILGAFLAGLCLNRVLEHRDVLREHVTFVGNMLFIPFFFVSTGMLLEIQVVAGQRGDLVVGGAASGARAGREGAGGLDYGQAVWLRLVGSRRHVRPDDATGRCHLGRYRHRPEGATAERGCGRRRDHPDLRHLPGRAHPDPSGGSAAGTGARG